MTSTETKSTGGSRYYLLLQVVRISWDRSSRTEVLASKMKEIAENVPIAQGEKKILL